MRGGKFDSVFRPRAGAGLVVVLLPAAFPHLALVHFPVFRVEHAHELVHAGRRPQLLLQVFARIRLWEKRAPSNTHPRAGCGNRRAEKPVGFLVYRLDPY